MNDDRDMLRAVRGVRAFSHGTVMTPLCGGLVYQLTIGATRRCAARWEHAFIQWRRGMKVGRRGSVWRLSGAGRLR